MITMRYDRVLVLAAFLFSIAVAPTVAQTVMQGEGSVDTVILASTENYPDAMIAAPAAKKLGIPVLLTHDDELPQATRNVLDRLQPSNVVMVGGPSVISEEVASTLSNDYNTTRLWGTTRYGTAVEVAEHFWVEGSDKAILIQNSLRDEEGFMLAAAKEMAREEMDPIYLTPDESVPAIVLSSLKALGVKQVTVVGTDVSQEYRSGLNEIGVTIEETVSAPSDTELRDHIQDRLDDEVNRSSRLLVVASSGFRHSISASNPEGFHMRQITGEDEIADVVALVNDRNVSHVKVAGQPGLARTAAGQLRDQTDATVELVVAEASEAVSLDANMTDARLQEYRKMHEKRMQRWQDRRQQFKQHVKERVNATINHADDLIDTNSSEEARDALRKAKLHYSNEEYEEAWELAQEAISAERERRFEQRVERGYDEVEEAINEETQDLQERMQELREINSEFAQEMQDNMTVEERLETLSDFRDERREKLKELMETARENKGEFSERLREARSELRERIGDDSGEDVEFRTEIECSEGGETTFDITGHDGYVRSEGTVALNTPNYVPSQEVSVDRNNSEVDVTVSFAQRDGFGIQCVAEADVRHEVEVPAGTWDVDLSVQVAGNEEYTASSTVNVAADDDEDTTRTTSERERKSIERRLVMYTEDGFSPQRIEIGVGDTVTWQSDGTPMWVASANHPTHTVYADTSRSEHCDDTDAAGTRFDQCESSDTYSFTFEKPGEWAYHNHVDAGHTGVVVVSEE